MLFRFVFKLGLGIALITIVGVALIRAQRVDDSRLVDFLQRGCEMDASPCWNGIRPGVTHVQEAVALLEAHPWVDDVRVERQFLMESIYWNWNDERPSFLDISNVESPPFIWAHDDIIDHIAISTSLSYSDVLRTLGTPELGTFRALRSRHGSRFPNLASIWHVAAYENGLYLVYMTTSCPASAQTIWHSSVTLSLESRAQLPLEAYDFDGWLYYETCQD